MSGGINVVTRAVVFGVALFALTACGSTPTPVTAVTSFAPATVCTDGPVLAGAVVMRPEKGAREVERTAAVGPEAPCLRRAPGVGSPYAVFALPGSGEAASVAAGGVVEPYRLFAATVSTIDAGGQVIRTFAAGDMRRRGQTLAVVFVPRPEERYVVVAADPDKVGRALSLVSVDPAAIPVPPDRTSDEGIALFRASLAWPYSYEGRVFARVYFAEPAAIRR
jgi:hypothetical protein